MAKTKISEFSTTAGNNTDINSINIAEGCAPSGINDAIRELMRQLKEFQTGGAGDSVNSGGDFSVATNKFTVASASGNTAVAGTLGVTGAATLSSTLAVTGTTTLTGALVANGNATLGDGSGDTVTVKGTPTLEVNPTLSGGTANGVLYLNGSKVATSGSALTFDGTNFANTAGNIQSGTNVRVGVGINTGQIYFNNTDVGVWRGAANSLSAGAYLNLGGYDGIAFATSAAGIGSQSEAMRLTSTGLGIGTSSPGSKLDILNTTTAQAQFSYSASIYGRVGRLSSGNYEFSAYENGANLIFGTSTVNGSTTERMRLDSSGNLGLGVTPSAWGSSYRAFETASAGLMSNTNGGSFFLMNNAYYNGTNWIYKYTSAASRYDQSAGIHAWYTAASGTAGDAITFTQALTLGSDGNLLVGTTSGSWTGNDARIYSVVSSGWAESLYTTGSAGGASIIRIDNTGAKFIDFRYTSTNVGSITTNGTTTAYNTSSDYRLKNITGPITNSGAYIDSLNPVEGTWKADGSVFVGLIAHEVQEASRTQVATGVKDGEEMQGMDYSNSEIIANIIAEIQSLRKRLADAGIA